MTTIDTARLRALAEAATPGPWTAKTWTPEFHDEMRLGYVEVDESGCELWDTSGGNTVAEAGDAEFIAAADPPTLIALLDRLEELEGREPEWEYGVRNLTTGEVFEPVNGKWWKTTINEESVRRRKAGEWEPVTGDDDA